MARYFRKNEDGLITVVNQKLSKFFAVFGAEGWNGEAWESISFSPEHLVEKDSDDNVTIVYCHGNDTIEYGRDVDVEEYSKFRLEYDKEIEYATIEEVYDAISCGDAPAFSGLIKWDGSNYVIYSFKQGLFEVEYSEVEFDNYYELGCENYNNEAATLVAAWENNTRQLYIEANSGNANEVFNYLEAIDDSDFERLTKFGYDFETDGKYAVIEFTHYSDEKCRIMSEFNSLGQAELERDINSQHYDRSVISVVKWDDSEQAWFEIYDDCNKIDL